ncbi:hypothetical protein [Novipirellula aureliae]|nr:hypothetical protein [Novipirellula aureliae]
MRFTVLFCVSWLMVTFCGASLRAAEPKAVALSAIASLFIEHDIAAFKSFVNDDAIQGDFDPGSAIAKIDKQRPEKMKVIDLSQVIFFRALDIDRLAKLYPDDLWARVEKHIGEKQGVLVKLSLTGEMANRARAAGKDPNDIAMMTFVLNSQPEPKIVHIDDN